VPRAPSKSTILGQKPRRPSQLGSGRSPLAAPSPGWGPLSPAQFFERLLAQAGRSERLNMTDFNAQRAEMDAWTEKIAQRAKAYRAQGLSQEEADERAWRGISSGELVNGSLP
jgi:hypothetical protein